MRSDPQVRLATDYAIPGKSPVVITESKYDGFVICISPWLEAHYETYDEARVYADTMSKVERRNIHDFCEECWW